MSASVEKATLRPALTASTARAVARWLLPVPWRSEQMDDLGPVDELQLGQRQDPIAIERGLEAEVEAGQCLDRGQPRHHQRGLHAPVLPDRQLLDEQGVERFDAVDFALLDAPEGSVENFERPRHPERHEVLLDAVERGHGGMMVHARSPRLEARRSPIAW